MDSRNPFSISYLTEASLTPQELLERYSFQPFQYLHGQIASTANVFLIGRRGVGKTMLLKIFEPELMSLLFRSRKREHVDACDLLPKATVGVYFNLASPEARLNLFHGGGHDANWWFRAYSDFLNTILLNQAIQAIDIMVGVDEWREAAGVKTGSILHDPGFSSILLAELAEESSDFDGLKTLDDLRGYLQARRREWSRFVNDDPQAAEPPRVPLTFGRTLFRLASAFRRSGLCERPFRVFVLIDQYEILHQRRNVIDYRPIFNEAMYAAARGGTGVEFKIGTRQYSYANLALPDGQGRIEADREMIEVKIDVVAKDFYRRFAIELFSKRLEAHPGRRSQLTPSERLPALEAGAEATLYFGESREEAKHLAPLIQRWRVLGLSAEQARNIARESGLTTARPLTAMLAGIAVTRWLRDGREEPPLHCVPAPKHSDVAAAAIFYVDQLLDAMERRGRMTKADARRTTKLLQAVDDFCHDTEQAALFQLASYYKNQRKYYAGLETVIRLSSNVAIVLIEILRAAYEQLLLRGGNVLSDPVEPQMQSEAIYRTSVSWFGRVPKECDFGETHQAVMKALGAVFRQLQLEITAPQPSPNGFSIDSAQLDGLPHPDANPRADASAWVTDAVSWGLLEEYEHQHKTRGRTKRRKYYLNRVFCPYFGIGDIWRKDPVYVRELSTFFGDLRKGVVPAEFQDLLRKSSEPRGLETLEPRGHQAKLL